jgi:ribonuclease HI
MAAQKKKFYAVVKGRRPGIYTQWDGPGGAHEQVDGFAGARFRGFASREAAEQFLREGGLHVAPAARQPLLMEDAAPPVKAPTVKAPPVDPVLGSAPHQAEQAAGSIILYTDGASTGNPGPGGWGAVLIQDSRRKELSGGYRCTTNNRMELMAVICALESLTAAPSRVVVYSDSRYVVDAVQKGWARRWRANGWMRARNASGVSARAENVDLWERLLTLLERIPVEFHWVRGHADTLENERCDRLAVAAAHQTDLPADEGFSGKCRG